MTSQSPSYQSGTLPTQETTVAESNGAATKTGNENHRCDKILECWVKLSPWTLTGPMKTTEIWVHSLVCESNFSREHLVFTEERDRKAGVQLNNRFRRPCLGS